MFVKIERLLQMFSRRIPFFRAISNENSEIHDGSKYYYTGARGRIRGYAPPLPEAIPTCRCIHAKGSVPLLRLRLERDLTC